MKKNRNKKNGKVAKIVKTVLSIIFTLILIVLMVLANTILPKNAKMVNNMLGYKKSIDNSKISDKNLDLDYYKLDFTKENIGKAEDLLSNQISDEGTVLLKNDDNTMPLKKGTEFSFFSANSSPKGSVSSAVLSGTKNNLKEDFEKEGFKVNSELWDFYNNGKGKDYGLAKGSISYGDAEDFSINEAPLSLLKEENALKSAEDTTPVFVLSRVAGEGRDMPRSMYNHTDIEEDKVKSYLDPDSVELEILNYLNENFNNVILVVKSNAALNLDWLSEFENIKSVVYSQTTASLPKIFSGEINPSGRTVDTFAANALNSPAAQNFGDYQYYTEDGKESVYNYVTYAEGIYIGYKYYETRYEDSILNQGNAGEYDYKDEVVYPFGYGLSYTNFNWDNYKMEEKDGDFEVSVNVTNTGKVSGKDVVEVFAQSPYTEYDKENLVEKPSVKLVGYAKSSELAPGQSEQVVIKFNEEQLKSYDSVKAQTYILEAGDYHIAVGRNSHDALNNILSVKEKSTKDGMTYEGNKNLASKYIIDGEPVNVVKYSKDSKTNEKITNLFDHAKGETVYLTRNDWEGTFPKPDGEPSKIISTWGNEINGVDKNGNPASYTRFKIASDEEIKQLESTDSLSPIDKKAISAETKYNQNSKLALIEMRGLDFDDPLWDSLLDQLSPQDYQTLIIDSGYGTSEIKSVEKPFNIDADTASGLIYGGTGKIYPGMMVLAQTWNQDIAYEFGKMIGNEALIGGTDGWYAPSMNMHRTPFSGRNGEYYSEDEFLSGMVGSQEVSGAASKGMYTFIKHFALNDQENHRGDRTGQYGLATWSNEQAIREVYLVPFEMSIKIDDTEMNYLQKREDGSFKQATTKVPASQGIMTAFNRLGATWTGGSYPLISGILRNEWGFNGFIITDNANTSVFMDPSQMIESGADAKLLNASDPTNYKFDQDDAVDYHYGRQAIHRILYTIANSKAMNGAMPGSKFVNGIQISTIVRSSINIIGVILIALMGWFTFKRFKKNSKNNESKILN